MLYLVHRPISADVVGMTAEELSEFIAVPDHAGLVIRVEMAFDAEEHACEAMVDLTETVPLD